MLSTLAVANYRSLHELILPLGRLNVVSGENGSGKSSLYKALRLLAEIAYGGVAAALAREGGLTSALWAGPETLTRAARRGEGPIEGLVATQARSLRLGFAGDALSYSVDLGYPIPSQSAFDFDPVVKTECIWAGPVLRPASMLVERHGPVVKVRQSSGPWNVVTEAIPAFDSMFTHLADPHHAPEVLQMREFIRSWRFYDHFRVDAGSPIRESQYAVRTPVLSHDGRDLAAALQTILEIGDAPGLAQAIDDAFPGSHLHIISHDGRLSVTLSQKGLLRALGAAELSDGTLRFLLWTAALLTPRPPVLMVLNEPETSLHPDLLPALARLIGVAATRSQLWVVSHSTRLIAALEQIEGCQSIRLVKELGETRILGQGLLDRPAWKWLSR
jgi:predicted ATPase